MTTLTQDGKLNCWLKEGDSALWISKKRQVGGVQSVQMTTECRNDLEGKRRGNKAADLDLVGVEVDSTASTATVNVEADSTSSSKKLRGEGGCSTCFSP